MTGITIKLPEEVLRQLQHEARATGRSVAALIRDRITKSTVRSDDSFFGLASDLAGSAAGARQAATNVRRRFRKT
jgi:predicted transcriptional regulator